jgi:hypothetical protein
VQTGQHSFWSVTLKAVVVHTVTYFVVGLAAFTLLRYDRLFAVPQLAAYMRPIDDPWVMAGPLFQPIRGVVFGTAVYLLRERLFGQRHGWMVMWWLFVSLGILSTFGPSPGSLEGLIYTRVSWRDQVLGLPEVIVQSLSLASLLFFWVRHPEKRWLNWLLGALFVFVLLLPALGLVTHQGRSNSRSQHLDAQSQAFSESQPGAVQEAGHEPGGTVNVGEDISYLVAGEDHWKSRGPLSAIYLIYPGERFLEDLIIEEEQSAKGLVFGRGADVVLDGEVGEEGSDFGFGHFNRVTGVPRHRRAAGSSECERGCSVASRASELLLSCGCKLWCHGFVDEITKFGCEHGWLPPGPIKRGIPAWGPSSIDIIESR